MAKFKDLNDFFDDGLELPIAGKLYKIAAPSAETGLYCQRLAEAGVAAANGRDVPEAELDDVRELELYQRVLGPTYDELIADGVSWPRIKHVAITTFMWVAGNEQAAQTYWEQGPEAQAPAATAPKAGSSTR